MKSCFSPWGRGGLLALALWLSSSAGAQESRPWMNFEAGTLAEVRANGDVAELVIPLRLAEGLLPGEHLLRPEVRSVGFNHRFDGAFQQAISAEWVPEDVRPTGLRLKVRLDRLVEPGMYDIILGLGTTGGASVVAAAAPRPPDRYQRVQLQLLLPPAQLQPVAALKIERVAPVLGLGGEEGLPPLLLRETSRRSHLTQLSLEDVRSGSAGLLLHEVPTQVEAGGTAKARYGVEPALPLGTTVGKLLLRAPQLLAPVEIPYEVTHRLAPWIIWPTLLSGLLLGFGVRVLLKARVERTTALLVSVRERRKLEELRKKSPDKNFQEALTGAVWALTLAEQGSTEDLMKAHADVKTTLANAMQALKERKASVQGQVDALALVLDRAWSLPEKLGAAKAVAQQQLAAVQETLAQEDAASAEALFRRASQQLQQALTDGARQFQNVLQSVLKQLGAEGPLRKAIIEKLAVPLDPLEKSARALPGDQVDALPEAILSSVHVATVQAWRLVDELQSQLRTLGDEVQTSLKRRAAAMGLPGFQALKERWAARPGDVQEVLEALPGDVNFLLNGLESALRGMAQGMASESLDELDKMLRAGDYRGAVRMVSDGVAYGVHDFSTNATTEGPKPEGLKPMVSGLPALPERKASVPASTLAPPSLEQLEARTFRQLALERWVQSAVVGGLVLMGGYFLFAPRFIGTVNDFAGLFFWAFGTDLSVETGTALARRLDKGG